MNYLVTAINEKKIKYELIKNILKFNGEEFLDDAIKENNKNYIKILLDYGVEITKPPRISNDISELFDINEAKNCILKFLEKNTTDEQIVDLKKNMKHKGSGSFGIVISIPDDEQLKKQYGESCRAIKVFKEISEEECENEFNYAKNFGELGIGVKVCKYGFCNKPSQYISIELFDTDGKKFLENQIGNKEVIMKFFDEVIKLVENSYTRQEGKDKFASYDIKYTNMVVKYNPFTVKLIDFSPEFCINIKDFDNDTLKIAKNMIIIHLYIYAYYLDIFYMSYNGFDYYYEWLDDMIETNKKNEIIEALKKIKSGNNAHTLGYVLYYYYPYKSKSEKILESYENIIKKFKNEESSSFGKTDYLSKEYTKVDTKEEQQKILYSEISIREKFKKLDKLQKDIWQQVRQQVRRQVRQQTRFGKRKSIKRKRKRRSIKKNIKK